jgi:hypothetical protein
MDSTKSSTTETQPVAAGNSAASSQAVEETIEEKYAHQLADRGERYMIAIDGSKQSGAAFKWLLKQVALVGDPSKAEVVIINFLPECDFTVEVSQEYQHAKQELSHCLEEYKRILTKLNVTRPTPTVHLRGCCSVVCMLAWYLNWLNDAWAGDAGAERGEAGGGG